MTTHIDTVRELLDAIDELLELEVAGYQRTSSIRYQLSIVHSKVSAHEQEVAELVEVVRKVVAWNTTYPSSRIYNETAIRRIAAEMDAIAVEAEAALRPFTGDEK